MITEISTDLPISSKLASPSTLAEGWVAGCGRLARSCKAQFSRPLRYSAVLSVAKEGRRRLRRPLTLCRARLLRGETQPRQHSDRGKCGQGNQVVGEWSYCCKEADEKRRPRARSKSEFFLFSGSSSAFFCRAADAHTHTHSQGRCRGIC